MTTVEEREFKIHELFFSTTDLHGKITSGNEVFSRISGYNPDQLILKPHSLIRHPDTPRVVFRLLWDRLGEGRSIAAYVKNKAQDGKHYWVMAFVTPMLNGYLSVRFKPSTSFLEIIEGLYGRLRTAEKEIEEAGGRKDEAITASFALLKDELEALGFPDYDSFIEAAFYTEFCNRRALLQHEGHHLKGKGALASGQTIAHLSDEVSRQLTGILTRQKDFLSLDENLSCTMDFISALSLDVQRASLNLSVKATKNGNAGGPLSVISNWLRGGAVKLEQKLTELMRPMKSEMSRVRTGLFHLATSQLQLDMVHYFVREMNLYDEQTRGYSDEEALKLIGILGTSAEKTFLGSIKQVLELKTAITQVIEAFSTVEREIIGLGLVYVNGRVESIRFQDSTSLEIILKEVMQNVGEAKKRLVLLESSCKSVDKLVSEFTERTDQLIETYGELRVACTECSEIRI